MTLHLTPHGWQVHTDDLVITFPKLWMVEKWMDERDLLKGKANG